MSTKKKKPRRVHDIVFDDDDDDTEATVIQNFSYSDGGKSLEIDNYSSDSSDLEDIFSGIRKVPTYGQLERRSTSNVSKKKQPAKKADASRPSVFTAKTYRKPAETQRKDNGVRPKLMPFGSSAGPSTSVTKRMSQTRHSKTKHPHTQHAVSADIPVIDISSDEEEPSPQRKRAKVYVQSTLSKCLTTKDARTVQTTVVEDESSTDSFELAPIGTRTKKGKAPSVKTQPVISESSDSTIMGGNSPVCFKDEDEDSSGREAIRNGSWNFMKFTSRVKDTVPDSDCSQQSSDVLNANVAGKIQEDCSASDTDCSWKPLRLSQNRRGVRREGLDIVICETDNDDEEETQDPNAESDSGTTLVAESSPVNTGHQLHRKTERRKSEETTPTPRQVPLREPIKYQTIDYSDDSSSDGEWLIKPSQTHTPTLLTKGTPPMRNPSQITKPSQEKLSLQKSNTKQTTLLSSPKLYGRKSPVLHKETNIRGQNQATRAAWKESGSEKDDNDDSDREGIFSYIRKLHQQSPKKPIPGVLQKQVSESTSDEDCVMKSFPSSSPFNVAKTSTPNTSEGPLLGHRVDPFNFSEDTEADDDDLPITTSHKSGCGKKRPASPVFGKSKKSKPDHIQDKSVQNGPLGTVNPTMGDRYRSAHHNQPMFIGNTKKGLSNPSQSEEQNHQNQWTNSGLESTSDHLPFAKRKEVQKPSTVDLTEDEETQDPNLPSDNEERDAEQVSAATGMNEDSKEGLLTFSTKGTGDDKGLNEDEDSKEGLLAFSTKGPGDDKGLNEDEDSKEGLLAFSTKGPGDDKGLDEDEDSKEGLLAFSTKGPGDDKGLNEDEDSKEGLLPFITKGHSDDRDLSESEDSREALLPFIEKEPSDNYQQDTKPGANFSIKKEPADDEQQEAKADFTLAFTQADVYVIDSDDDGEDNSFAALSQSFVQFPIKEESEEEEEDQELSEVIFVDPWNADIINTSVITNEQSTEGVAIKQEKEEEDLSESLYLTQKAVQEAMNNWSDDETYLPDTDGELTKLAADAGEGWSDCDDDLLLSLDIEPAKPSSPATVKAEQKSTPSVTEPVKVNQQNVKMSTPISTKSNLAKYSPVKYRKIDLSDEEGGSTNKPNVTIAPQQTGVLSRGNDSNAAAEKSPDNEPEVDLTPEILTQIINEPMEMDSQIVLSDEEDGNEMQILCSVDYPKALSGVTKAEKSKVAKEGMSHSETRSDTVSSLPSADTLPALEPQPTFRFSIDPKVHKEIEEIEKSPEPFVDGVSKVEYADDLTDEQVQSYLSAKYTSSSPDRPVQSEPSKAQHEPIVISDDDNKVDQQVATLSVKDNTSGPTSGHEVAIDLTDGVKISSKTKDKVEKEELKVQVTKDRESRQEEEAAHKSRDQHPSSKGIREDTKPRVRSKSRSPVGSKGMKEHDHEATRKEDTHKSASKSSTTREEDKKKTGIEEDKKKTGREEDKKKTGREEDKKKTGREEDKKKTAREEDKKKTAREEDKKKTAREEDKKKTAREDTKRKQQPPSSSSSHTSDRKDGEKYKDAKSRSSSKVSEGIKKQSEKKHVGSSSSSDKDRTKEKYPHSTTSKTSTHSKDDRRREDRRSSHADISKDKKEPTKSKERSSSSSRSSHTSKTVHSRDSKDSRPSSSTSRSRSKSPKPHSKHESSSRPKESDRTKLHTKEKPSSSAATTPKLHSKGESSSKPKESDRTHLHSGEKPSVSTTDESDEGKWMSVTSRTPVVAQKTNKLLGKSMEVSPSESSKVPSAAVAKFQARMRGNPIPVQKPSISSRSKKKTRIAAPRDDNLISMTQSIENAKVNMYERAQRAREERQRNKEVKSVTKPSGHEKKSTSSSSHDRSKSRSNKDDTSAGTKGKPENTTTKSSKEDKNAKPSTSKHSSNSDKSKGSSSHQSTSSSSGKKDSTVSKAIEDITESFRNLSQSQSQTRVETSESSTVAVQCKSNSTTVKTSNVTTSSASAVPKNSETVTTSNVTSGSSSTSAVTAAVASTSSAVSQVDEPTVKKRRINLPVAAVCSSTVPGTYRPVQQDPYELLKAMPALTIGDSGKNLTVDDFLNIILQWIPKWLDEMDAQEGTAGPKPLPPFMSVASSGSSALLKSDTLWPVPDTFENAREYFEIMLGHILHEVWSATYSDWRKSKNRPTMGSFIPVSKDSNDTMFHTVIFQGLVVRNQQVPVSEGDLVIVHMKSVLRDGRPSGIQLVFGYVQRTEKTEPRNPQQLHPKLGNFEWVRNTKRMVLSVTIRFFYRILPDNDFMDIQVVTSLISVLRQIGGLIAFPRNPLSRDLLEPTRLKTFLPTEGREDKNLDKLYNSSQVRVINSVVASLLQPFVVPRVSLIQGPPGTGKSHTILAIIRNTIFRKTADGRTPCLMLCAPSNAAIDELVRRISIENDIRKMQGTEMVRVVRIGSQASMSENSRQYSLDTKVKEAWENRKLLEKMKTMPMSIRKEMLAVHEQLPGLRRQLDAAHKAKAAEQVRKLEQDIDMLEKKEAKFKDTGKRNEPTSRDTAQLRYEVLAHSHIVACTLNSAGSRIIADAVSFGQAQALNPAYKGPRFQFTGVLIDEACQCVEVEALIPLQYCATKLVLIGDPQQLPPTVISQDAETMKFSQSLFERLYNYFRMKSYSAVFLLDTQYRMHPEIAVFPSRHVYDGRLKTDPSLAGKRSLFPFRHYFVFDLVYGREQSDQRSLSVSNPAEVEFVLSLVKYLTSTKVKPHLLGIITPYKKQKLLLQDQLRNCNLQQVDVGTVDGFQGQEKDVIIVSCVRACSSNNKIGFVADKRRLNVALTRAKYGCYIVGHMTSLRVDADWGALVEDAVKRQVVVPVKSSSVRDMLIHKVCVKPVHTNTTQKNKAAPNVKNKT